MSRKYQNDVRLILGIDDTQGGLDSQRPKAPISGVRGMAWFSGAGSVDSGSEGGVLPEGAGSSVEYNLRTETTTEWRTVPRTVDVEDLGPPNNGEEADAQPKVGDLMTGATGFDCTTGDPIKLQFGFDECVPPTTKINCEDVCVETGAPYAGYNPLKYVHGYGFALSANAFAGYAAFPNVTAMRTNDTAQRIYPKGVITEGDFASYGAAFAQAALRDASDESVISNSTIYIRVTSSSFYKAENISPIVYSHFASNKYIGKFTYTKTVIDQWGNPLFSPTEETDYMNNGCYALEISCTTGIPVCDDPQPEDLAPCLNTEEQCEEYPWDDCDCYQTEKRGDLKAGWDSVDMYREPVNCREPVGEFGYVAGSYFGISGSSSWPAYSKYDMPAVAEAYKDYIWGNSLSLGSIAGPYGTYPNDYYIQRRSTGSNLFVFNRIVCGASTFAPYCTEPQEVCDQYPEQCANGETDPTAEDCNPYTLLEAEDCCGAPFESDPNYNSGFFWAHNSGTYASCHSATPQGVFDCVKDGIELYNGVVVTNYYCVSGCDSNGPQYWDYQFYVPSTPETTYTNPMGFVAKSDCSNGSHSAEPYCNPTDEELGKTCNWPTDGEVSYIYNPDSGRFEANPLDADLYETQQPSSIHPSEMNVCGLSGNPISMGTATDGGLVITYDPETNGGVTYVVRGSDGKITAAGSGSSRDDYLDPDDPLNWI